MKIENYYLDLNRVEKLQPEDKKIINDYYRDMIYTHNEKRFDISNSLFLTLFNNGYLRDVRVEKITHILNEDNSISS